MKCQKCGNLQTNNWAKVHPFGKPLVIIVCPHCGNEKTMRFDDDGQIVELQPKASQ